MQVENRFLVLKWEDIALALDEADLRLLHEMIGHIQVYRMGKGKPENRYVVINADEPYFPDMLKLMEAHEKEQEHGTDAGTV